MKSESVIPLFRHEVPPYAHQCTQWPSRHRRFGKRKYFCDDGGAGPNPRYPSSRIVILNLMPKKIETETQLLRLLGNTPLQVDVELLQTASHQSKNTPAEHLVKFYCTFDQIKQEKFDGMVITGAPVEQMEFEEVDYWPELCEIMEWTKTNVFSTFHICWGAQAGLYYHYGIPKYPLPEKKFGIFLHQPRSSVHPLLFGFDEEFWAPHSRHTEIRAEDIRKHPELSILADSQEAGVYIVASENGRQFFVTGVTQNMTGIPLQENISGT